MHVTRNRAQRLLALDGRRHVYNYIHEMGYDPTSTTTVTTPLDPNIVYSQEDCPAEVDVDLRAKVWAAHGKLIHLAVWSRPDLAHAVSVLGRYVHNPSQKLWLAYHRIAKYLIRTKTYDGNPLGWRAHGRNARGQADHEELAHMVNRKEYDLFRVTTNLILFRETGVLDRELNLASIP